MKRLSAVRIEIYPVAYRVSTSKYSIYFYISTGTYGTGFLFGALARGRVRNSFRRKEWGISNTFPQPIRIPLSNLLK